MQQYLDLLGDVRANGTERTDRTGTGTRSVFGRQLRFDLAEGFPLVTTKQVFLRGIIHELLWFLSGDTNIAPLVRNGVHIWDSWPYRAYLAKQGLPAPDTGSPEWRDGLRSFVARIADDDAFAAEHGDLGPVYGYQWRHWRTPEGTEIDQVQQALDLIRDTPDSRRIIVSAWNAADIEDMAKAGIPPCHTMFQFYVDGDRLSCQLYQRSADLFLGVPFNIASYALLTMMFAQVSGLQPGEFVHTFGDAHIYANHYAQVDEQLSRTPRPLPRMELNPAVTSLFDFTIDDFTLVGYDPHPRISAPVAV